MIHPRSATPVQLHGLTPCGCSHLDSSNVRHRGHARTSMQAAASDAMPFQSIEAASQPRITPEGKAQTDSNAQQPRQVRPISRGLLHRYRVPDGVMKPLRRIMGCPRWQIVRSAAMLLAVASTTLLGTHTRCRRYHSFQRRHANRLPGKGLGREGRSAL